LNIEKGIVEHAKIMGIHIIRKGELKNISTRQLEWAFWITVHLIGDGDTLPPEPPGEVSRHVDRIQRSFRRANIWKFAERKASQFRN